MTAGFQFHAPTRVRFGLGVRGELPNLLEGRRWSLLTSPSVLAHSGIEPILDQARANGTEIAEPTMVSPNPRLGEVEAAIASAPDGVTGVLAVGGGSVVDAGKLLRSALLHGASGRETLDDFSAVSGRPDVRAVRLVAVPTTAGTGAEVSRGAIITDDAGTKRAARGEELVPDMAVIDPELTLSQPRRRTAEAGFDVLAHAIETYLSRAATPVTEILSLAAVEEASGALLDVLADGGDLEGRTKLSLHAWLMGYNLAHASTCLPHRLQYPIGSATDTSHQIGLAVIYPAWMAAELTAVPERTARLFARLRAGLARHLDTAGSDIDDLELLSWLLERLDMRVGLADLGLSVDDVPALVDAVSGRLDLDPIDPDRRTVERIYRQSVEAWP